MAGWSKETFAQVCQFVMKRASEDQDFRALAVVNPAEAVRQVSDMEIPEGLLLQIVDPAIAHLTLALPPLQAAQGELSDAELAQVAGAKSTGVASQPDLQGLMQGLGLPAHGRLSIPFGGTVMVGVSVASV